MPAPIERKDQPTAADSIEQIAIQAAAQKKEEGKGHNDGLAVADIENQDRAQPAGEQPVSFSSEKVLLFSILGLVALIILFFLFAYLKANEPPLTIEDMHALNLKGEIDEEKGHVYRNAYSFLQIEGFWYTQLTSPNGELLFNLPFRYPPRDLEGIKIHGSLNAELFNNASTYYVTFNPAAPNQSYAILAMNDFNQQMYSAYEKTPKPACDRNETEACKNQPIITCDNTKDDIVLYINYSQTQRVELRDNCIIISGNGFDLVKGVDRLLYSFYRIMDG